MEPFESADNFNEDVGMFEAATHSSAVDLTPPHLKTIVMAPDGSDRDATLQHLAKELASRTSAQVEVLSASTTTSGILEELNRLHPDLLILPVPFGQDYHELGSESLGSVADQLLLKAPCPVLCVRDVQDLAAVHAALNSVIVPIAIADDLVPKALSWGFLITPSGGRLDLVAVADRDVFSDASHFVEAESDRKQFEPSRLSRAMLKDIGGIVAAAQKKGGASGRKIHVETRVGQFVPLTLAELHGKPHMIIWAMTRDHTSPTFHRAIDLLLASKGLVLMV